jgi:exosome complex RNA-binding protein Rrp42 (RNase PH superfamily)
MESLNAELLKKVHPRRYFEQYLADGLYPDGRTVTEHRPFRLDLGVEKQAYGSSLVQQSGACVSCAVSLSVAPQSDEPAVLFELEATERVPTVSPVSQSGVA